MTAISCTPLLPPSTCYILIKILSLSIRVAHLQIGG